MFHHSSFVVDAADIDRTPVFKLVGASRRSTCLVGEEVADGRRFGDEGCDIVLRWCVSRCISASQREFSVVGVNCDSDPKFVTLDSSFASAPVSRIPLDRPLITRASAHGSKWC